jgi:hypothetical protein
MVPTMDLRANQLALCDDDVAYMAIARHLLTKYQGSASR